MTNHLQKEKQKPPSHPIVKKSLFLTTSSLCSIIVMISYQDSGRGTGTFVHGLLSCIFFACALFTHW